MQAGAIAQTLIKLTASKLEEDIFGTESQPITYSHVNIRNFFLLSISLSVKCSIIITILGRRHGKGVGGL